MGTHAILQPTMEFKNLGLVVVDEEQRFGVVQKETLKKVSSGIDVLTLSATPIPRTLQMALTGLRDLSVMITPPEGRKEVIVDVGPVNDQKVRDAILKEVKRGGQVFCVVPFVSVVHTTADMLARLLPEGIRIIEAHGEHSNLDDRIDLFASGKVCGISLSSYLRN